LIELGECFERLVGWMEGGDVAGGAPLRTDQLELLHPPTFSPWVCASNDTQPSFPSLHLSHPHTAWVPLFPPSAPDALLFPFPHRQRMGVAAAVLDGRSSAIMAGQQAASCSLYTVHSGRVAKARAATDIRRASVVRPLSGDPGPLEMGGDF
jgi:hypothetical protein